MKHSIFDSENTKTSVFRKWFLVIFVVGWALSSVNGQRLDFRLHFKEKNCKQLSIPFESAHNLIIVPVFINGSDTLKFILDSGVNSTVITGFNGIENLTFNYARELSLMGLGEGEGVTAYHTSGNVLELPGIIGRYQNILILKEEFDHISQGLGIKVNGLLGSDIFDSFIVEINYYENRLTLYDPDYYYSKKRRKMIRRSELVKLDIEKRKPYVSTFLTKKSGEKIPLRLLIDTGASNAVTLFKSLNKDLDLPENALYTYIGLGLSGDIYGHLSRVNTFYMGDHSFQRPIITYPDESSLRVANDEIERNGSIGGEILKRFTVLFDYQNGELLLRPNPDIKKDFRYNLSGLNVVTPIPGLPLYEITKVREGSPAWIAGLEVGDQIKAINGLNATKLSLSNIVRILQSRPGRKMKLDILRDKEEFSAKFTLEDPI